MTNISLSETPVVRAEPPPPSLSRVGAGLGAKTAAKVATLYAVAAALIVAVTSVGGGSVIIGVAIAAWMVGIVPALLIGAVSGWLAGKWLASFSAPLTEMSAFAVGVATGTFLLCLPTVVVTFWLLEALADPYGQPQELFLLAWYLPALLALAGIGWTSYRLNQRQ